MTLFAQELRKIWRPGLLLALALLGLLYYYLFPSFYIRYFCNGPTAQADFDLAAGWVETYGTTMEPEERQELDAQLSEEIAAFAQRLQAVSGAAERGLTDYESFLTLYQTHYDAAQSQEGQVDMEEEAFLWKVMNNTNYFTIQSLENYLVNYDWKGETSWTILESYVNGTPAQQARILALEAGPRGYLPSCVTLSTTEYAKDLGIWIVLAVVLLLSPTLVRDRLHRTRPLQWSSRRGRGILRVQLAAGLVSALAVALLSVILYAIPFVAKGPLQFRACPLFSWARGELTWFSGTYGQYLLVLLAMLFLLALAAGGFTLFLSQYSGHYVAMLLKAIPLFLAAGVFAGGWLLEQTGCFRVFGPAGIPLPKGCEAILLAGLLAAACLLLTWACRRQRKREL